MTKIAFLILLSWTLLIASCEKETPWVRISGKTMGTTYNIVLPPSELSRKEVLAQGVEKILIQVNQEMSTYIPSSQISQFNSSSSLAPMKVSPHFYRLVQYAKDLSIQTQGAYDITVGPLVNLWGFGSKGRRTEPPQASELQAIGEFVGIEKLKLGPAPLLQKSHPRVEIDLSSSAKGHGVDRVASYLNSMGLASYLIEIGGEVRSLGQRGDRHWQVGIERPSTEGGVRKVIALVDNMSMATSGDYRNFFIKEGKRFSHTLDPRSSRPIDHALASVTVLDPECMKADAMATALMVMGEKEGLRWAEQKGIKAYFIYRKGDVMVEKSTSAFKAYIEESRS